MKTRHTAGPWRHEADERAVFAGDDSCVADLEPFVFTAPDDDEEIAANGKLIAAAPELLASLDELLRAEPGTEAWRAAVLRGVAARASAGAIP